MILALLFITLAGACLQTATAGSGKEGASAPSIRFRDVTAGSGVTFRFRTDLRRGRSLATIAGGVAAADVDADGDVDLYFSGAVRDGRRPGEGPEGVLYLNRGDGTFEDATEPAGIHGGGWVMGAHFADLDADDRPDLLLTASGGNRLYGNLGDGRFGLVPHAGGLERGAWSVGAAFLDADRDGRLDVYIGDYLDTDYAREQTYPTFRVRTPDDYEGLPNGLYLQSAGGGFRDATEESGAALPGSKTLGVAAFDADGDGIDDLFIANDRTPNALLRGRGDGTFADATAASGVGEIAGRTGPRGGMGIAVGDPDTDGDADVVVTNFAGEPVTFYRNAGGGIFEDATAELSLESGTRPYVQWGVHLEDLDNDGELDLPIVSGHLVPRFLTVLASLFGKGGAAPYGRGDHSYRQPANLYRGAGGGRFVDGTARSGDFHRMRISGRGSACADFDGDGRLDLAITAVSGGVRVLRNETARSGRAIEFIPRHDPVASGAQSTLAGTKIAVWVKGKRYVRAFGVVPSYASGSWIPLHFGLGEAASAERVEIFPPGARSASAIYLDVPAERLYAVTPGGLQMLRTFVSPGASP